MSLRARAIALFGLFVALLALAWELDARSDRRVFALIEAAAASAELPTEAHTIVHLAERVGHGEREGTAALPATARRLDSLVSVVTAAPGRREQRELLAAVTAFRAATSPALSGNAVDSLALERSYETLRGHAVALSTVLIGAARQESQGMNRLQELINAAMIIAIAGLIVAVWFGFLRPSQRTLRALEQRAVSEPGTALVTVPGAARELARLVAAFNRVLEQSNRSARELRRAVRVTDALYAALRAGRGVLDLGSLAQIAAEVAADATTAEFAAVAVREPESRRIRHWATAGFPLESAPPGALPEGDGLLAPLVDGKPIRVPDAASHPGRGGVPAWHPAIRNLLGVPVKVGPQHWGEIYVANRTGGDAFGDDDEAILHSVATFLSYAAEQGQAHAEQATAATIRETVNLLTGCAHEINNSVAAAQLNLRALEEYARSDSPPRLEDWREVMNDVVVPLDHISELVRHVLTASGARAVPSAPAVDLGMVARHAATRAQEESPGAAPISVEAPEHVCLEGSSAEHAAFVLDTLTRWCARRVGAGTGRGGDVFVKVAAPDGRVLMEVGHRSLPHPADIASIFEPAARADQRRGTVEFDLDLLLVRAAVQRAGATIEAVPMEGGAGISFRSVFPAAKAAPAA